MDIFQDFQHPPKLTITMDNAFIDSYGREIDTIILIIGVMILLKGLFKLIAFFKDNLEVALVWTVGNALNFLFWFSSMMLEYPLLFRKFRGLNSFQLRSYSQICMIWDFVNDIDTYELLFDLPIESDHQTTEIEIATKYLTFLRQSVIGESQLQTRKLAKYLEVRYKKDFRMLYEFMTVQFDYDHRPKNRKAFETINLPNQFWSKGEGACEDFAIFISGVLCNWNIKHNIVVEQYYYKKGNSKFRCYHTYIETEGGTIYDFGSGKFNQKSDTKQFSLISREVETICPKEANKLLLGSIFLELGAVLLSIFKKYAKKDILNSEDAKSE